MSVEQVNLLELDREGMAAFLEECDEAPYRGDQIFKWVHQQGVSDINLMTNLSKKLRENLLEKAVIKAPAIVSEKQSKDGTFKWLLKLDDGNCIETVYIPEDNRGTLCVSSQVGCALNCSFCSTGKQGFSRNLTVAEIIGQVWIATRQLSQEGTLHDRQVTNVVMMGMGEPLLNFDRVVTAMEIMLDDFAYGLSKRRVTLSTSGIIPEMLRLKEVSPVALAISLHAPNDELRNELVPINKKYPLKQLMAVCKDYFEDDPRRMPTYEYVMLDGVNDQVEHARQLVKLMRGVPGKINLIPFNPFPFAGYKRSKPEAIARFQQILQDAGLNTIVRKTRGDDIDAACGQLVGQVQDRTNRSAQNQLRVIKIQQASQVAEG